MDTITQAFTAFRDEPFVCDDASMADAMTSVLDDFDFEPSTPRREAPTPRSFAVDARHDPYDFVIDPPAPNNTSGQPLTIPVLNSDTNGFFSNLLDDTPTTNNTFSFAPLTTPKTSPVGGAFGIPNKVIHISQGRKKELGEVAGSFLASRYNDGYIDFSFPAGNDPKPANNLFLGWRIAKRMMTMGYDIQSIDRVISIMGNRYCLGCANKPDGSAKNGDIIAGTMHCNQCAKLVSGSVDDHIDQFLAMDFNKWAKNVKRAM
jgi:hypothetical protein